MTDREPLSTRAALLRYEKTLDCVHCGLCLPHCPTYDLTGDESHSPRGRIHLMRALAEARIEPGPDVRARMDGCLVCRACETVCPSGVEFGRMMEITREEIRSQRPPGLGARWLQGLVTRPAALDLVAALGRAARGLGLPALLRRTRLDRLLGRRLRALLRNLPEVPPRAERRPLEPRHPASTSAPDRGSVVFLEGCVMRPLFGAVHRRAIRALTEAGHEVIVPRGQGCCGALHAHSGDLETARALARRNVLAFEDSDPAPIVLDSAGCGAALKDMPHWFAPEDPFAQRAAAVARRVVDLAELLEDEGFAPRAEAALRGRRVVWDAPCHLHHAQGVVAAPLALLRRVPGIEILPLEGFDRCCGAAGSYVLTQPETSEALLEERLDALERSGADLLVTANPGCLLQWRKGIAARGLPVEVRHIAELL